jgi:hypothetical protein
VLCGGGGGGDIDRVGDGARAMGGGGGGGGTPLSCNGEHRRGPRTRGLEARAGSSWLKLLDAGADGAGEQITGASTTLVFTKVWEKYFRSPREEVSPFAK